MRYKNLFDMREEMSGNTFGVLNRCGYLEDRNIYSLDGLTKRELMKFWHAGSKVVEEIMNLCAKYDIVIIDDTKLYPEYTGKYDYIIRIVTNDNRVKYLCRGNEIRSSEISYTYSNFKYDKDLINFNNREECEYIIKQQMYNIKNIKGVFCIKRIFDYRYA